MLTTNTLSNLEICLYLLTNKRMSKDLISCLSSGYFVLDSHLLGHCLQIGKDLKVKSKSKYSTPSHYISLFAIIFAPNYLREINYWEQSY